MESATPGVKSTGDGWLNRVPAGARAREPATPFRAVALAPQLPRIAAGPGAGARDRARSTSSASAAAARDAHVGASFEAQYAAAADRVLNGTGREAFDAMHDAQGGRPGALPAGSTAPTIRAAPFGQALQQIAQLVKADVGLEIAFAEVGGWDTTSTRAARRASSPTRLDDFGAALAALATDLGDSDGRHGRS